MISTLKVYISSYTPKIIFLSFLLSCLAVLLGNYVVYGAALVLLGVLWLLLGEQLLLVLVIISLFTLFAETETSLRTIVHLVDFGILGYLFFTRFGLKFNSYPRVPKSVLYFILLYYSSVIISMVMSSYPLAGVGLVIRQTIFFILTYLFYALIRNESDIKSYFIAFVIAACVLAGSSLLTFMSDPSSLFNLTSGSRERIVGLISNPNNITNFYMVSFPIILSILFLRKSKFSNTISFLLILYLSFALFITLSRSAIMGVIASIVVMLYILKRKYFYFLLLSLLFIVLLFIVYEPLSNLASVLFRVERGATGRDYLWALSLDIIKDHPIFGIGPGAYRYEMFSYFPVMLHSWTGGLFKDIYEMTNGSNLSHNYFLFLFSDLGILGMITALALPVIYFRIGIKTLNKYKYGTKDTYYLIVTLFSIGAAMFVRGMVESIGLLYYGAITTDLPFWLVFISLIYYYKCKPEHLNAKWIES
jgi:O-antigen ligase